VRNVDDGRLRHNVENDAFDSTNKMIIDAKIGGERDNRTMRQLDPSLEDRVIP
jgi:hypothetical protein